MRPASISYCFLSCLVLSCLSLAVVAPPICIQGQGGALSTPLPQNRGNGGVPPGYSGDEWDWCYVHRGTRGANLKPVSHQPSPHLLSPGRRCSANEQGRPERRISDISESEHVMTCFFVVGRSGALSNKHNANYPREPPARGSGIHATIEPV